MLGMIIKNPWALIAFGLFLVCLYCIWKARRKTPLNDRPGLPPEPFLLGLNDSELPCFTLITLQGIYAR